MNDLKPRGSRAATLTLAIAISGIVFAAGLAARQREAAKASTPLGPATSETSPGSAELIQPDELAKVIQAPKGEKPLVLYVGPQFLWAQAHIPGAEFIGATADPQSLRKLRARAASLPHDRLVVLYCGCCPWNDCPNIRPGFRELRKAGIKNLRALYLANSFRTDWVAKGFPTVKGGQ